MANTKDDKDSQEPDNRSQSDAAPAAEEAMSNTPSEAEAETEERSGEDPTALDDDQAGFRADSPADNTTASQAPARRRGGLLGPVIGGVLAAGIGYGAAQYVKPEGWPFPGIAGLGEEAQATLRSTRDELAQTTARLADLEAQVAELGAAGDAPPDLSEPLQAIEADLSGLAGRIGGLESRLNEMDGRVEEIAKTQVAAAGEQAAEAVSAYEREIAAMRDELVAQREENAQLAESVASVADEAEAELDAAMQRTAEIESRAALMRIGAALASGASFESALDQIQGIEVPEPLAAVAAEGVPTMAELRDDFPPAARAALAVAREVEAQGDPGDRVGAFLRNQLGVRSLEPREGDDADAVLSRAEAALRGGDLRAALAELDTLPEPVRDEMSGWIADATARADAVEAAEALEQSLNN
ncbi:hypothetical protein SAMN05444722_2710 [Rhodovulum sp. ES.010]|uniref:COG4223 family protein n=1 Tax=Rhodovulum sp. ES.010 TaxID=1882821 RepID=UPI00092BF45A|nr:hypothetical protein [Rhodovulum sp. ES.010]SIO49695.1 hypothetical protein SAMN05444722_2710 [Rhodovulum sp. ES.010]